MWVWPQALLGGTSPSALPHASPGRPRNIAKKRARGVGGQEEEGGEGRAVVSGRGRPVQCGGGGDPPKDSWGHTHIWGVTEESRRLKTSIFSRPKAGGSFLSWPLRSATCDVNEGRDTAAGCYAYLSAVGLCKELLSWA